MKKFLLFFIMVNFTGCYYLKSAYHQMHLLSSREPIVKVLKKDRYSDTEKEKMKLTLEVMDFVEKELLLKTNNNYRTFVELERPYVTTVVSAAHQWKLEKFEWNYPIVGRLPYKGFFNPQDADEEMLRLKEKNLDVAIRGVSAYSTLGWFRDPLLSSMLRYSNQDLIDTLIHESVHVTLFIKGNADFNERLAVFLAQWGTELFIKKKFGENHQLLNDIRNENSDTLAFSLFIDQEIATLREWYSHQKVRDPKARLARLQEIKDRYQENVKPRLKGSGFKRFEMEELNNASLLLYGTYMSDLSQFAKLREKLNLSFSDFVQKIKTLENSEDPEQGLRDLITF